MSNKHLFSAFTKKPKNPFSVVIKEFRNTDTVYITYSLGPKNGGGSWGEDIRFLNPRTIHMIEEHLSEKHFEKFKAVVLERIALRDSQDV